MQGRVYLISPTPDGGGAERLVWEMVKRLPELNWDAYGLYFANPRNVALTAREDCLGSPGPRSPLVLPALRKTLHLSPSPSSYTLYHTHLTWPLFYTPVTAPARSILVHTEHNTTNRRRNIPGIQLIERRVYRAFKRVVAVSEPTADALRNWLGPRFPREKVRTILNGVPMMEYYSRRPAQTHGLQLVTVGSLTRQKGHDVALQAVSRIRDHVRTYWIVGEGPERGALERQASELSLHGTVKFVGWQEEVQTYLQGADLFVMPSRWEGLALAPVEALSTGLPVVGSNIPGIGEVLQDCPAASLVPPESPGALVDGIISLADRLQDQPEIGRKARTHAERFSFETMVGDYAALYQELIGT